MTGARPDTWMPLYVGSYLKRTMHLTSEQHGAYLLLIMACWCSGGSLPKDDAQLAAIVRAPLSKWRVLKPIIAPFFDENERGWTHERVSRELANAEKITNERSTAGKRGAKARWSHKQTDGKAIAEPLANASQTDGPSPSPSPSSSLRSEELSLEFERFYKVYPRHVARKDAERAFAKARKTASLEQLMQGARRYAASVTDPKFVAYPATWLNSGRWLDEIGGVNGSGGHGLSERRRPQTPPDPRDLRPLLDE